MARVKDLTREQVRALEDHYREWRAAAARSGPSDRNVAQNAIGRLYTASGHDWPSFVWYQSPRELLTFSKSLGSFKLVPLRDSLLPEIDEDSGGRRARFAVRGDAFLVLRNR